MAEDPEEDPQTHERLVALLDSREAQYEVLTHAPARTSEEAAQVRGSRLSQGAKAMLFRSKGKYALAVVPADLQIDSKRLKRLLGWKSCSMASREQVWELTRVLPGGVPPFGSLFELPTVVDERLKREETLEFNAGLRGRSVRISCAEYLRVEQPRLERFAKED